MHFFDIENGLLIKYTGPGDDVIIPEGVTSIGEAAFADCGLTSVEIPGSVTTIGGVAFAYCYGMKTVVIREGVNTIKAAAFMDCNGLMAVDIPESVTSIGNDAFRGCRRLTSINYKGTQKRWQAMYKGFYWALSIGTNIVHCMDGDVKLK